MSTIQQDVTSCITTRVRQGREGVKRDCTEETATRRDSVGDPSKLFSPVWTSD